MNKPLIVVLAASLAANVALLVAARRAGSGEDGRATSAVDRGLAGAQEARAGEGGGAASGGASGPAADAGALRAGIQSRDLAVVRDSLRAAGVPEEYVRAVVMGRIRAAHRGEFAALARALGEPRFWVARDRAAEETARAAERELDQAIRSEFTQYFDEPMGEVARARQARERLAFLPGDKAEAVTRISNDYNELRQQIQGDVFGGVMLEEDQQKLALLEEERQADLARVLTPEELEQYELHTSRTAQTMRARLGLFEPSETEFRAIFALQREFDREFGSLYGPSSQEMMRARSEAQRRLGEQIGQVLGPERYGDYQRATNYGYMSAVKIADHFKLPRENAVAVYQLEAEYRRRTQEAMRSSTDRTKAMAAAQELAAEATARVTALLGEEGTEAFRQSGGGWLRVMEERGRRTTGARQP